MSAEPNHRTLGNDERSGLAVARGAHDTPHDGAYPRVGTFTRLRSFFASLVLLVGVLILAAWMIGELCSDRWYWSQWLEWTPTSAVLVASAAFLSLAGLIAERNLPPRRRTRVLAWAAWSLALVYMLLVDWRVTNLFSASQHPGAEATRVVFWNAAAEDKPGWSSAVIEQNPDIAVIVTPHNNADVERVRESMGEDASVIETSRFTVLSRRAITSYAATKLDIAPGTGLDPRQKTGKRLWADPGHAMYVELAKDTHRPAMCVWLIDLPSDLSLARWEVTRQAAHTISTFRGPVMLPDGIDRWAADSSMVLDGFPEPDLIAGDFNIPRGSRSLDALTDGKVNAFDQCAAGPVASWPCTWPKTSTPIWPVLHIDQIFTGPSFRAASYVLINPGSGTHRMQRADVVPAP